MKSTAPVADAPTLVSLDPTRLKPLRGTKHAELKNDLMMALLTRMDWYRAYRRVLDDYRERDGLRPQYPTDEIERVETLVDNLIRKAVDTGYRR